MKRLLLIITITLTAFGFANAQGACNGQLDFHTNSLNNYLNSALATPSHMVYDDMQVLMFTPDVYWAGIATKINCPKSTWPANWMDSFSDNYNKLKGFIETEGKTRAWKERLYQRPTEQAIVRTKFLAKYPGVTILKIGSDYKDWKVYKTVLGIPTNRYVRGEVLLKFANRPYCQAQTWAIKQTYKGGSAYSASVADGIGGAGYFVMCP